MSSSNCILGSNNSNYEKLFDLVLIAIYSLFILFASYIRGPIYQLYSAETSYILLFNGVNLLKGEPLGFIVHSLPLIEAGAVITFFLHILEGGYSLADSVVKNAETYAIALDFVVFVFVGAGMVRFFRCLRRSLGLAAGILAVLPFLAMDPWGYVMVLHGGPEFFGLGCAFWALSFLWRGFERGKENDSNHVIIAGVFIGLGFATKVNFFPVLFASLLVARPLFPFSISVILTVGIVYLPIMGQLQELFANFSPSGVVWQGNVTSQKGILGMFEGVQVIAKTVPFYFLIFFFILVVLLTRFINIRKKDKQISWLGASFTCGFLALILTSLRPVQWYLLSSLPFLGIGMALSFNYFHESWLGGGEVFSCHFSQGLVF